MGRAPTPSDAKRPLRSTASVTATIMVVKAHDELLACDRFLRGRRQHEKLFLNAVNERDTKL